MFILVFATYDIKIPDWVNFAQVASGSLGYDRNKIYESKYRLVTDRGPQDLQTTYGEPTCKTGFKDATLDRLTNTFSTAVAVQVDLDPDQRFRSDCFMILDEQSEHDHQAIAVYPALKLVDDKGNFREPKCDASGCECSDSEDLMNLPKKALWVSKRLEFTKLFYIEPQMEEARRELGFDISQLLHG